MSKNQEKFSFLVEISLADTSRRNGGDEEDRTPDLLNANQALSQLSYVPIFLLLKMMVGLGRLELPTPRLSSVCSNQLSYKP